MKIAVNKRKVSIDQLVNCELIIKEVFFDRFVFPPASTGSVQVLKNIAFLSIASLIYLYLKNTTYSAAPSHNTFTTLTPTLVNSSSTAAVKGMGIDLIPLSSVNNVVARHPIKEGVSTVTIRTDVVKVLT